MAMKLVMEPKATVEPDHIPAAGGLVSIGFTAETRDCLLLVAEYVITAPTSYRFAELEEPQESADRTATELKANRPRVATVNHFVKQAGTATYHSGDLSIVRGKPSTEASLAIDVKVKAVGTTGMMEDSRDASARCWILSGGLQEMFAESGLSKTKWAEQLSKSLGRAKDRKLSAGTIIDALNGKNVSARTTRILGGLLPDLPTDS